MRRLFVVPLLFLVVLVPAAVAATGVPGTRRPRTDGYRQTR